jgi:hypothetical protein
MPEKPPEQTDFFDNLEKPADAVKEKPETEPAAKEPPVKRNVRTIRMDENIPGGRRLGGWMSQVDGNPDAPDHYIKRKR